MCKGKDQRDKYSEKYPESERDANESPELSTGQAITTALPWKGP